MENNFAAYVIGVLSLMAIISVSLYFVSEAEDDTSGKIIAVGNLIYDENTDSYVDPTNADVNSGDVNLATNDAMGWRDFELKDVTTQETFRISDFDKPILLESFAVWCPTCKRQQDEIQKLINRGDDSIHISINTDSNEDEEKVIEHVQRYSYTWHFVIFPIEATRVLVDEFGTDIVNVTQAPIVLICPDGIAQSLRSGVKSAEELKEEIGKC